MKSFSQKQKLHNIRWTLEGMKRNLETQKRLLENCTHREDKTTQLSLEMSTTIRHFERMCNELKQLEKPDVQ